jgi:ABC-type antimicrobial peptide transport system permease subunit
MTPEIHNGMTFKQALSEVLGTKAKAIRGFAGYATVDFDVEDMGVVADMAILKAWREWDPIKSKFNTLVTSMISWQMFKALDDINPVFRTNRCTKMNFANRNETFDKLYKAKITKDEVFNKMYGLDGVKEFTRALYNTYVYHVSEKEFGNMLFMNRKIYDDTTDLTYYVDIDDEIEDALNTMSTIPDKSAENDLAVVEFEIDLAQMPTNVQKVYTMINAGHTLKDSLDEAKLTKYKLKMWHETSSKSVFA